MIIPIRTDYRMTRTPWVNYALIAANVIVFLARHMHPRDPWMLYPDGTQLYQFFSYAFLHANWVHLIGNMIFLWVFGNALNDRFGQAGYLAFYLAAGVLSGTGYILLEAQGPVLGASGAISAVTGAYLVLFPRVRVTLLALLIFIFVPFEVSSLLFLMFQFIWNLAMSVTPSITGQVGIGAGVAYAAHCTGYVFGIAVAAALLAARVLPREPYDLLNLIRAYRRRQRYRQVAREGYDAFGWHRMAREEPEGPRWVQTKTVASATADTAAAKELRLRQAISDAYARHDLASAAEAYLQLVQVADEAALPRQQQLDVANHMMASEKYPAAADAYERFLRHYANYEHLPDIHLMLGLLYGRYLLQYDRAELYLQQALDKLTDQKKIELAQQEMSAARRHRGH